MSKIKLEIITPEKIVFENDIDLVSVPSSTGQLAILAGHVPILSKLVEGEVKIVFENREIYLAIGGGFMEITINKVTILVTSAYQAEEINEKEVLEAKKRAHDALSHKPAGLALLEAEALFRRSEIALKVLRKRRFSRNAN